MTDAELRDALNGIYAYDTGSTDSGIHDEALRERCLEALREMPRRPGALAAQQFIARMVRDLYLSEEALAQGYGIEDADEFLHWLDDQLGGALL